MPTKAKKPAPRAAQEEYEGTAKPVPVPVKLGDAIDKLMALRNARKKLTREAKDARATESKFEDAILLKFKKSELEGARGKTAQASVSRVDYPTITDFAKLAAYIVKNRAVDLVQRRLSADAVRARWSDGKEIPGIGHFNKVTLHLSKAAASKVAAKRGAHK